MTAGLLMPGVASASTTARAAVIATASQAGYVTGGGRHFRYIEATIKVSPARKAFQYAALVLGGNPNLITPEHLAVKAGGGPGSVAWSAGVPPFGMGGITLNKLSPSVGDTMRLSIYYDQHGNVYASATDVTKHVTQTVRDRVPAGSLYTAAEAAVFASGYTSTVATDFKLWTYSGVKVTTYSGIHGTMLGPWTTSKIVYVTGSGAVVMSPSVLRNSGATFSVWRR